MLSELLAEQLQRVLYAAELLSLKNLVIAQLRLPTTLPALAYPTVREEVVKFVSYSLFVTSPSNKHLITIQSRRNTCPSGCWCKSTTLTYISRLLE